MSAVDIVHQDRIVGKLTCFDRLIFKGQILPPGGVQGVLGPRGGPAQGLRAARARGYVTARTDDLKAHAKKMAAADGRPYLYLGATHTKARGNGKEDLARSIAERDEITEGLICVLAAVENCTSFDINKALHTTSLLHTK